MTIVAIRGIWILFEIERSFMGLSFCSNKCDYTLYFVRVNKKHGIIFPQLSKRDSMFTGLIREFAAVKGYANNYLHLQAKYRPKLGDSIAVNGVCLTVVTLHRDGFSVELSAETRAIIAQENFQKKVHIEPAMQLKDRFEGHVVQGHVDALGSIEALHVNQNATDVYISYPKEISPFLVPKGSIAIDGVSLTINEVKQKSFRLTIISHTMQQTLFAEYKKGRRVHIETDMFARYLYHMFHNKNASSLEWSDVDKMMALY